MVAKTGTAAVMILRAFLHIYRGHSLHHRGVRRGYSTLLYATLRYSTLLYATLRYSTLLYATLRYSTLLYATLRYSTLLYATLRYSTLHSGQLAHVAFTSN
jgi:uncharacterized protein YjbI with pentapeptide repeats